MAPVLQKILEFFTILLISILMNFLLTTFLYYFATDDDFANLPKRKKNDTIFNDRLIALFYFNCSTYGTLGDALIYPKSNRAKLYTSFYVLLTAAGLITILSII
jgi:hypothetical protein